MRRSPGDLTTQKLKGLILACPRTLPIQLNVRFDQKKKLNVRNGMKKRRDWASNTISWLMPMWGRSEIEYSHINLAHRSVSHLPIAIVTSTTKTQPYLWIVVIISIIVLSSHINPEPHESAGNLVLRERAWRKRLSQEVQTFRFHGVMIMIKTSGDYGEVNDSWGLFLHCSQVSRVWDRRNRCFLIF